MKYVVKLFKSAGAWEKNCEFKTYKEAREKCILLVKKLTGDNSYYSEPNGDIREGFFGDTVKGNNWTCMIEIE